ncbi:MAG: pilus assembly protein [Kineosporiaceae bacterium]|nr:pilus assembly protein [Aeromicrobium sp.]
MVQTVIIAPVLFLLIMFVVQFALLAHAQNVAEAAAQEGVTAARRFGATDADGRTKARDSLSSLGPKMLSNQTVTVDRTQTTATVTIRGQALSLIPGFHRNITETSSGPVERYVAPEQDNP